MQRSIPRRVFFVAMEITVLGILTAFAFTIFKGWVPPRGAAGVVLPLYFSVLLAALSITYVVSGDTLMHHHATGTIRRATSPGAFWSIVGVQVLLALALLVFGIIKWSAIRGSGV